MRRDPPGNYVEVATAGERFQAFVPAPLPPEPPVEWTPALRRRFDDALVALGRLDAMSALLPNAALLLYSFVRKEAVLSTQIEGTQSSLADLLLFEIDEQPGVPVDDAREVSRCVAALEHGLQRCAAGCRCRSACCARCMRCCWITAAGAARRRARCAARRFGSVARGRATPSSCRRRPTSWPSA